MLKRDLQTSILLLVIKKIKMACSSLSVQTQRTYAGSQIQKLIRKIKEVVAISFKCSILGKFSEIRTEENLPVLDNSRFIMRLTKLYKRGKGKITDYLKIGNTVLFLQQFRKELYFSSIKIVGNILLVAISINIILSILFKIDIGILGWITRLLLLSMSLGGFFCNARWEDIEKTSYFIKHINNSFKS